MGTIKFNSHIAKCEETTNLIAVENVPHEDDFQTNPGNLNEGINPVNKADKIKQVISQTLLGNTPAQAHENLTYWELENSEVRYNEGSKPTREWEPHHTDTQGN